MPSILEVLAPFPAKLSNAVRWVWTGMTIEIHDPEVERIVKDAVLSGRFESPQDVVSEAVIAWRGQQLPPDTVPPGESLLEFFRRSPLVGLELDFERDRDVDRDVAL